MNLIFLFGFPGVGKLTVAQELSNLAGLKTFHNHLAVDLALSLFEFGSQPFVELREKVWLAAFAQAVEADLAGLIFTFAFDRSVRSSFIEKTKEIVESAGGEVLFVELTCSVPELERRIAQPSRQRFGKIGSVELFRELNEGGMFVDPGIPAERLTVDTTALFPTDAAKLIATKLTLLK